MKLDPVGSPKRKDFNEGETALSPMTSPCLLPPISSARGFDQEGRKSYVSGYSAEPGDRMLSKEP